MAYISLKKALLVGSLVLCGASVALAASHEKKEPALKMGASDSMLGDTCAGCHGTDGVSQGPAAPTISGLSIAYFEEVMQGFKSGEVPSTIMQRIAKGYTDGEIKQMANYYGGKPFVKAKQDADAAKAKEGAKLHDKYCEKCHAEGGTSAEDDAGILAGQWIPYVRWTMDDFHKGDREMPKKMKKKMDQMMKKEGDAGLEALYHYYASQK